MTRLRALFVSALLALPLAAVLLAPFASRDAKAATAFMCQGDVSGASTGARAFGGVGSAVPSQTLYTLNSGGCLLALQADIGYFLSQGFTAGSPLQLPIIFTTGVWTGTTNFVIGTIPANGYISNVFFANSTANAVTGGISLGTTANGVDIIAAQTCAANCQVFTTDALLLKRVFPATTPAAAQPLNMAPVTAGNNANVTVTVVWGYF